ncbi:dehydration-responsive protein RD22-like [Pyrus ussuriensis x Pyrus communis]|uniref:Dehydration-responsive protein RD22-like n=1 Tax=Pyrus ussuriensis x Pyrus communis TaxID=2448454 RepID=A0A5N5G230_9ROSA|nr:dehydration-responsive protein RD22-like [Pyrus ussuriensis x Pyrus communis]
MAFHLPLFFSLLNMAVVVALASQDAHPQLPHELYWNSVLPNARMPKAISQLLQPHLIAVELGKGTGFDLIAGEENLDLLEAQMSILLEKIGREPYICWIAQERSAFLFRSNHALERSIFAYRSNHAHATHENHQLHKDDNPQATLFFLDKDMHLGTTMNMNINRSSNTANFLLHKTAELIAFSLNELPDIFNQFSVKSESEKYCATSLESMIDFTTSKLGRNIQAFSTEVLEKGGTMSIISMKKLAGDKAVVCHKQNYPYTLFYRHATKPTRAYVVPLRGSDGVKAKAVTICHVKPGTIPICHFLPSDDVVWVPTPKSTLVVEPINST